MSRTMQVLWREAMSRPTEYQLPDAFLYLDAWVKTGNYRRQMLDNPETNFLHLGLASARKYLNNNSMIPGKHVCPVPRV